MLTVSLSKELTCGGAGGEGDRWTERERGLAGESGQRLNGERAKTKESDGFDRIGVRKNGEH